MHDGGASTPYVHFPFRLAGQDRQHKTCQEPDLHDQLTPMMPFLDVCEPCSPVGGGWGGGGLLVLQRQARVGAHDEPKVMARTCCVCHIYHTYAYNYTVGAEGLWHINNSHQEGVGVRLLVAIKFCRRGEERNTTHSLCFSLLLLP